MSRICRSKAIFQTKEKFSSAKHVYTRGEGAGPDPGEGGRTASQMKSQRCGANFVQPALCCQLCAASVVRPPRLLRQNTYSDYKNTKDTYSNYEKRSSSKSGRRW